MTKSSSPEPFDGDTTYMCPNRWKIRPNNEDQYFKVHSTPNPEGDLASCKSPARNVPWA